MSRFRMLGMLLVLGASSVSAQAQGKADPTYDEFWSSFKENGGKIKKPQAPSADGSFAFGVEVPFEVGSREPVEPAKKAPSTNHCRKHPGPCTHGAECGVQAKNTLSRTWTSQEILTNATATTDTFTEGINGSVTAQVSASVGAKVGAKGGVPGFGEVTGEVSTSVSASLSGTVGETQSTAQAVQSSVSKSVSSQQAYSASSQPDVPPCTIVLVKMQPFLEVTVNGTFSGTLTVTYRHEYDSSSGKLETYVTDPVFSGTATI